MWPRWRLPAFNLETWRQVQNLLEKVGGSSIKVKKGLHECIYRQFTTRCKPQRTFKNRKETLNFVRKHLKKHPKFWNQFLWTDETKINLYQNDGKRKEQLRIQSSTSCVQHGGGRVMAANGTANSCLLIMWLLTEASGWILGRIGLYPLLTSRQTLEACRLHSVDWSLNKLHKQLQTVWG